MRIVSALLFFFALPLVPFAQEETDVLAELELTKTDGQLEMSGYCTNQSGRTRSLSYKLIMLRVDSRNNRSSSNQGGMFELGDGARRLLSTTSINIDEGSYMLATLEIYEGEKLLAQTREVIGEIPKEKPQPAKPQQHQNDEKKNGPQSGFGSAGQDIEIGGGFIVDDTRTRAGQEFYDEFYRTWKEPQTELGYIIRIEEKPAPGRSTQVSVLLDGEQVFARMLQPKPEMVRELAKAVANYVHQKIVSKAQVEQALDGDQSGSGLY